MENEHHTGLKIGILKIITVKFCPKNETFWFLNAAMRMEYGMANSLHPDQTASNPYLDPTH